MAQGVRCALPILNSGAEDQDSEWKEKTNSCGLSSGPPHGPTHTCTQKTYKNLIIKIYFLKKNQNLKSQIPDPTKR